MGNLISFNSPSEANINSLKIHFKPKQDAQGQTGKNLLNRAWFTATNSYLSSTGTSGTMSYFSYTDYITLEPNTYTISGVNNTVNSNLRIHSYNANKEWVKQLASVYIAEGSSFSLTFTVTSDDKYLRISAPAKTPENPYLQLEVGSSATAYVPYENICPIEGWESVEVYMAKENLTPSAVMTYPITFPVVGKNLYKPEFYKNLRYNVTAGTELSPILLEDVTESNDIFTRTVTSWGQCSMLAPVIAGKTYIITAKISAVDLAFCEYMLDKDKKVTRVLNSGYFSPGSPYTLSKSFTVQENEAYMAFYIADRQNGTITIEKPQLELGSTATTYELYSSNNTIYGGYVDFAAGKVVQTHKIVTFDGTEDWSIYAGRQFKIAMSDYVSPAATIKSDIYCNKFDVISKNYSGSNYTISGSDTNTKYMMITVDEYVTTVEQLEDWLEANPLTVCYPLETPIEYPITPIALKAFHGPNNIWSNTNSDTEILYDLYETSRLTTIKKRIIAAAPHVNTTSTASFTTDMRAPLPQCKVSFVPRQGGSGTASPTNVRPIYGLKYLSVMNSGKNLVDVSTFTTGQGLNSSGQLQSWSSTMLSPYIPLPGGNYYVSGISRASGTNNLRIHGFDENYQWVKQIIAVSAAQNAEYAGTFDFGSSNVKYIRVSVNINTENLQIEQGTTKSQYEPYSRGLWTADWETAAGEVYGGYVDLVSGEVWKTHHKQIIDETSIIGIFPWGGVKTDSTTGIEYVTALFRRSANDPRARNIANNLCDKLPYSINQSTINTAYMYDGDTYGPALSLPISLIGTTQETLEQYLTGNPFTFVYTLREPVLVTTLTPTQLLTFKGTNNLYASHNTITAKYWTH